MAGEEEEAKVVRGASLLILLQVVSRAITFVANQVLLRFLTAELLGISTQLEVYYLSVLFFARESLRVAIQRQGSIRPTSNEQEAQPGQQNDKDGTQEPQQQHKQKSLSSSTQHETQAVVNLSYISISLGVLVAALLGWMYLRSIPATTVRDTPYLVPSVYIYAAASVLELLSEPAFVVTQIRLQFAARARAEGLATFAKCVVTLASAVWAARQRVELGVLPFALGQVAFGLALLGSYTLQHYLAKVDAQGGFSLLPRRMGNKEVDGDNSYVLLYFYRPTVTLASSMMIQSFVKHLLTQGDTFLVSVLSTPTAQGVYALANNYGGLAARLVFQPVEESSRNYFSRLLSSTTTTSANGSTSTAAQPITQGEKPQQDEKAPPPPQQQQQHSSSSSPSPPALTQASENLTSLLRIYALISLPLLALGPTAAPLVLSIVAGPQWTSSGAGTALAAYVYYIPLLAINGLTEAFVASVASEAQVHRQSGWMTAFSLVFAAAGYLFLKVLDWGAVGLVWANGINMGCRIVWAVWFIRGYFASAKTEAGRQQEERKKGGAGAWAASVAWDPTEVLPSPVAVAAAAVASQVVRKVVADADDVMLVAGGFKAVLMELVKVAGVAIPFVGVL